MVRPWPFVLAILVGLPSTLAGCSQSDPPGAPHTHHADLEVTLCGLCGQVKDSDKCCQEEARLCPKCGLHRGSPGCCKIEPAPKDLTGETDEHAHDEHGGGVHHD